MKKYTLEFFKDKKKEWRWRIVAKNKKIVAVSGEGYKRPSGAKKSLAKLLENIASISL